jgi:hypothetical protein
MATTQVFDYHTVMCIYVCNVKRTHHRYERHRPHPRSASPFDPQAIITAMDAQPHPTFPPAPMAVTDRHAALGCPLFLARVEAHAEWKACLQAAQAHLSAQCPLFLVTYPQNPVVSLRYSSAKASYWFAKASYSSEYVSYSFAKVSYSFANVSNSFAKASYSFAKASNWFAKASYSFAKEANSNAYVSYWFAKASYSFACLTFANRSLSILPQYSAPRQQRNASGRSPPGQRATAWQVLENQ